MRPGTGCRISGINHCKSIPLNSRKRGEGWSVLCKPSRENKAYVCLIDMLVHRSLHAILALDLNGVVGGMMAP